MTIFILMTTSFMFFLKSECFAGSDQQAGCLVCADPGMRAMV